MYAYESSKSVLFHRTFYSSSYLIDKLHRVTAMYREETHIHIFYYLCTVGLLIFFEIDEIETK